MMKKMNFLKVSAIALSMFMVSSCSEDNVFFNVCDEDVAGSSNTSMLLTRSSFSGITSLDIDTDVNADGVLVVPADAHYMIYSGSNKPTDHRIVIEDGGMVTLAGVNITAIPRDNYNNFSGITCEGNARIYLADNTENKIKGGGSGSAGIEAGPIETTLTIKGITGKLEAFGENGAAIGSKCGFDCGDIVIEGGIIIAKTEGDGAAIGSGKNGHAENITVLGSKITADCRDYGAGIGSGYEGSCRDIIISGGTVEAIGEDNGAGIGSGFNGACREINISGSTVTARCDYNGAGIGSGFYGTCDVITIDNSTVTSHSVYAAGIGAGGYGKNQDIIINSGTIIASSDECGAGIGSAPQGYCCAIIIKSAVTSVTATKGDSSPNSIGAGYEGLSCHVDIEDPSKVTMK